MSPTAAPVRLLSLLAVFLAGAGLVQAQSVRLSNLSTRGNVGTGANIMISGFVVGPGTGDTLLIRGVGPGLNATFDLSGFLPDPQIALYASGTDVPMATYTDWNASIAATMASVGAFSLTLGSKDTAFVTTLAPGAYTAELAGVSGDSGIALAEVYEVAPTPTSSRLTNLSTRIQVGAGSDVEISGISVSQGTGDRLLLVRAVGPSLGPVLGLSGGLADPTMTVLNSNGTVFASNDNWGTPVGAAAASAAALSAAFAQAGAFPLTTGSLDSAILAVFPPGDFTVQVSGNGGATGMALLEVYDITSSGAPAVTIAATQPNADTSGGNPGAFTVTRTGDTSLPLVVDYSAGGTANSGIDYAALSGVVVIPAGSSSATIAVLPNPTLSTVPSVTVMLTLTANYEYTTVGTGTATVTITNIPATLYVATLRPPAGANSTASGTATILLNPDGSIATVNVSFSNLTSTEVTAHLDVGLPGNNSVFVFSLPYGEVTDAAWTFSATGTYSSAALLAALKAGNIYVEIDSQNYTTGELTGQYNQSTGSEVFTPPAAPPAINLADPSANDSARFLEQATFGPTTTDINNVVTQGYSQWIANEVALPETSHLAATNADAAAYPPTGKFPVVPDNRYAAWWLVSVTAPDQLRQRVAFALSEIFVVSDVASSLANQPAALANYYDTLARDAFGNFRQLLQDVTLSPVMGNYLDMLQNAAANPKTGTSADENYAREVMQLFTIGLNFLNPDGTLQLDSSGQPIPTYTNTTIVQTANVFTGWSYDSTASNPSFYGVTPDWTDPMLLYPAYHDNTQKTVVAMTANGSPVIMPANEGGAADLNVELNTLFNHQNTAPFFCRQLIERLVTSNPSPGYVYRIAQVFANDGTGTRGNLAAVVKAILLDYEARTPSLIGDAGTGKLKEPILRQTALYRAFDASSEEGRFPIFSSTANLGEMALSSSTVFNFFPPDYVPPGILAAAGLYGPEFQITTASTAMSTANTLYGAVYTSATPSASTVVLNLSSLTSASGNTSAALIATLNQFFCGGSMSAQMQAQITSGLAALPNSAQPLDRARFALDLVVTASEGAIQQ